MTTRVIVEADGGSRGNPGPAGYGAVVRDADTGEVLREVAAGIGVASNNVAEYRGLIAGLQAALDVGAEEVDVRMDSLLVVNQMSQVWKIKHEAMRPLASEAAGLVRQFRRVEFHEQVTFFRVCSFRHDADDPGNSLELTSDDRFSHRFERAAFYNRDEHVIPLDGVESVLDGRSRSPLSNGEKGNHQQQQPDHGHHGRAACHAHLK